MHRDTQARIDRLSRYYRMDSCSSKGDNNRAKRHYPPLSFRYRNESVRVPPFLGILLRGTKSTPIFNLSNTVSIIIPPIYDSFDQIEPIATKIGRVPSQLPSTMPPTNPFFRFESIKLCPPPKKKFPWKSTLLTPYTSNFLTRYSHI